MSCDFRTDILSLMPNCVRRPALNAGRSMQNVIPVGSFNSSLHLIIAGYTDYILQFLSGWPEALVLASVTGIVNGISDTAEVHEREHRAWSICSAWRDDGYVSSFGAYIYNHFRFVLFVPSRIHLMWYICRIICSHVLGLLQMLHTTHKVKDIVVVNLPPLGCTPAFLTIFPGDPDDYDDYGCLTSFNAAIELHNEELFRAVLTLRAKYPDLSLSYGNFYRTFQDILKHPSKFGEPMQASSSFAFSPTRSVSSLTWIYTIS